MDSAQDLVDQIGVLLASANTPLSAITTGSAGNDLYELFLLAILLEAVDSIPELTYEFRKADGSRPTELTFRRGPGRICSPDPDYCHAEISSSRHEKKLEAHLGIVAQGRSDVRHEGDLLVVPQEVADTCRSDGQDPSYRRIWLIAEAKFYGGERPLPLGLGRGFLGLITDVGVPCHMALASTRPNPTIVQLLHRHHRAHPIFAAPLTTEPTDPGAQELRGYFHHRLRGWAA